ncbi:MAG: ADP-ribosylation factor-like protein [Promethearchaeota archaeon]
MLSSEIDRLVKITFIGAPAVGKTTMLKLLSQQTIDRLYMPTHGLDLKTIKFDDYFLRVWDLAGQKSYLRTYSKDYLLGSDIIFVVTDSTPKNVLNSRELINYACHFVGRDCPIIAIANKQDMVKKDGRMDAKRVEDILHIRTYGLIAINPSERLKLMNIIKKELDKVAIRRRLKD